MFIYKHLNKKKFLLFEFNALIVNLMLYSIPLIFSIFLASTFSKKNFLIFIIAIIIVHIIQIIGNYIWSVHANGYLYSFENKLQISYMHRILDLPIAKLNNIHSGFLKKQVDIISAASKDLVRNIFDNVNGIIISSSIFLYTVFNQDKIIFLVCILFIIIIIIYNIYLSRITKKKQTLFNSSLSVYNSTYTDILQNMKTLKRIDGEDYAASKIGVSYKDVSTNLYSLNKKRVLRFNGVSILVLILFIIILVNLFLQSESGINVIAYLAFYMTIYTGLERELRALSVVFENYNSLTAANNQVEKLLSEKDIDLKIKEWNNILIKDVFYKYELEDKTTIDIPYFELNKYDKVSIVGKSGQGKTTFLNIFSKFLKVDETSYLIDGKYENGRLDIAYISQEIDLLNVSIYENLTLNKKVDKQKLDNLLKDAELLDWINSLPNKFDTIVGERGLKLSAGQKQRLNLIRGILLDKEIYILDEPTSNLDIETEKQIINLIETNLENKTVLIVTHRLDLEKICNNHYYFDKNVMKRRE